MLGLQFIRWRRKPRWEPMAKNKIKFKEPSRPAPTEGIDLQLLHNHYRAQLNSIRFAIRSNLKYSVPALQQHSFLSPQENLQDYVLENNKWNFIVDDLRGVRQRNSTKDEKPSLANEQKDKMDRLLHKSELSLVSAGEEVAVCGNILEHIDKAVSNPKNYSTVVSKLK